MSNAKGHLIFCWWGVWMLKNFLQSWWPTDWGDASQFGSTTTQENLDTKFNKQPPFSQGPPLKKKKHPVNISQQLFWTCVFEKKHHGGLLGQKVRHANRSQALDFVVAPENRRLLLPLAGKFGVPLLNSIDFSLGEKRSQEFQPHELFLEGQAFLNIHVNMEIDLNKM